MSNSLSIKGIITQIDNGQLLLPEFQRGYVWKRPQVKDLMVSLYRRYPIGGLLFWNTKPDPAMIRNVDEHHNVHQYYDLILDGQQRITSLYGLMQKKPPKFFEGDETAFTDLCFNVETEEFSFKSSAIVPERDPFWFYVSDILSDETQAVIDLTSLQDAEQRKLLINRIIHLRQIDNINISIETVPNNVDTNTVVDIFNKINSGGTTLGRSDLAFARICALWPQGRNEIRDILGQLQNMGYDFFDIELFLRCLAVNLTGKASYNELLKANISQIANAVKNTHEKIKKILDQIISRIGLDGERFGSKNSIPLMIYCLNKLEKPTNQQWNRIMYWFIHTILWGRYNSSVDSKLMQDIKWFDEEGIEGLISHLLQECRGGIKEIKAVDFEVSNMGTRFVNMLYILTRSGHAKDWGNGLELSPQLMGCNTRLEVHHIFPKNYLRQFSYTREEINRIANFTFLTQETNLEISDRPPRDYMPEYKQQNLEAIKSHWIPCDDDTLFEPDNYKEFLAKRMELLADAANKLLDHLYNTADDVKIIENYGTVASDGPYSDDAGTELVNLNKWLTKQHLTAGIIDYIITDDEGNEQGTFDMAWPNGLQNGLSQKLVLFIDEATTNDVMKIAGQNGYRFFTSIAELKQYVQNEYLR